MQSIPDHTQNQTVSTSSLLPRKEVIPSPRSRRDTLLRLHPQSSSPTLDSSLLAVGPPASGVTNSHGVTGGVYKARERIPPRHADSRLLAIPASCSRVADCSPNCERVSGFRSTSRLRLPLIRPL